MSGESYLANAGIYLINIVFFIFILAVMLRFLLQTIRADFYNPICQTLITLTNPALNPYDGGYRDSLVTIGHPSY